MVNDVLITTLKATIGTMLSATAEQMASKLILKPTAAAPNGPPTENVATVTQVSDKHQKSNGRYRPRMRMQVAVYKSLALLV